LDFRQKNLDLIFGYLKNRQLTKLSLTNTKLDYKSCEAIADLVTEEKGKLEVLVLNKLRVTKELSLLRIFSSIKTSKIKTVDFGLINISTNSSKSLCFGLNGNKNLKTLKMNGCNMSEEVLKNFIEALEHSQVTSLDISGNPNISNSSLIFVLVTKCKNLESLYVCECNLKDSIQNLSWALEKSNLTFLSIDNNKISKNLSLLVGVAKSKLVHLSVKRAQISIKDIQQFFSDLKQSNSNFPLQILDVQDNAEVFEIPSYFLVPSSLKILFSKKKKEIRPRRSSVSLK